MAQHPSGDPIKTVLVTGASGFIAKHICLRLLKAGYRVVGSVRDEMRGHQTRAAIASHLGAAHNLDDRLRLVRLDLDDGAGWDEAMRGVDIVMHTASPLPLEQPDDARPIVKSAVEGTLRALRAARMSGIDRVVMTSSTAAVMNTSLPPGRARYDESDWSDPDHPTITPYAKSKTLAERAAWDFVAQEAPDLDLTVINPAFVLGPPLDDHLSASIRVIQRLLRGKDPFLPDLGFTCVDVRDIADMHLRALSRPQSAGRRIVGADRFFRLPDMAQILAAAHPDRKIPRRQAPDWLVRIAAMVDKPVRSIVPRLGQTDEISNRHAQDLLGMSFIDVADSLRATSAFLVNRGLVDR